MTAADQVAAFLAERGIRHAFGIIGAGNVALFDAISRLGKTEIVCTHHEQAAVMAANAYYRISGEVTVALVTTGAGSANALTGVLSAFMDSIPVVVIAGNEPTKWPYVSRSMGVQGWGSVDAAEGMTKWAIAIKTATAVKDVLDMAFEYATIGRPGPCWVEIPMDVQASEAA